MSRIHYRSSGLVKGASRRVGSGHVHIDGNKTQEQLVGIVQELERYHYPSKFNHILYELPGPQRAVEPATYAAHTPPGKLNFFSVTQIGESVSRLTAIRALQLVNHLTQSLPEAVLELEQVIGCGEQNQGHLDWRWLDYQRYLAPLTEADVGFPLAPTLPYEIHHGFNLSQSQVVNPEKFLEMIGEFCIKHHIEFGGWFVFELPHEPGEPPHYAFRSNAFCVADDLWRVPFQYRALADNFYPRFTSISRPFTLVESVLGIRPGKPIS